MGKIKKRKSTKGRVAPYDGTAQMVIDTDRTTEDELRRIEEDDEELTRGEETGHRLSKRHADEWKAMKKEVALLKKSKQKLRKKVQTERDEKRGINKKIKTLLETTKKRHIGETQKLGSHQMSPTETTEVHLNSTMSDD